MQDLNSILNLDESLASKTYPKGTILQHAGEKADTVYYVKKGLLKSYTIDKKGKEYIFIFAPEDWLLTDIESLESGNTAELFIEALEDCEVIAISRTETIGRVYNEVQYKKMTDLLFRRVGVLQRRIIMLMSASAQERYEYFLETYPALPNRVPQRMIASYLGITPEALSKIRGRMARDK